MKAELKQIWEKISTIVGIDTKVDTVDTVVDSIETKVDALDVDTNLTSAISISYAPTTREASLQEAGGIGISKEDLAITGNGAIVLNVFQVAGCVQIKDIVMIIKTVTDATTFSNVKFVLYDGTNTVDLTDVVDGSGTVVGSKFLKSAAAGSALSHLKADQVRILESTFQKPLVEAIFNSKYGVNNYIQLSFTGDANTVITANIYIRWTPI